MLTEISKMMTHFFIRKNVIAEEDKDTYEYCFEIFVSTIVNLLSVVIIAIATGMYLQTVLFLTTFMLFRSCAGGYHADTHFRCFLILMVVYGVLLILLTFVSLNVLSVVSLVFIIVSSILTILFAPVEHINNPMSKIKRGKLRVKSLCLLVLVSVIAIVLLHFNHVVEGFSLAYGMTAVLLSCMLGNIKNKIINRRKK